MSHHTTRYLLESQNQGRYDEFASVDEPERLEAELALARTICQQAVNAKQYGLAANLLKVIGGLSAATVMQKVRMGELLEKAAVMRLSAELVQLVTDAIRDRFDGWELALDDLTNKLAVTIETANNDLDDPKQLEGPHA